MIEKQEFFLTRSDHLKTRMSEDVSLIYSIISSKNRKKVVDETKDSNIQPFYYSLWSTIPAIEWQLPFSVQVTYSSYIHVLLLTLAPTISTFEVGAFFQSTCLNNNENMKSATSYRRQLRS